MAVFGMIDIDQIGDCVTWNENTNSYERLKGIYGVGPFLVRSVTVTKLRSPNEPFDILIRTWLELATAEGKTLMHPGQTLPARFGTDALMATSALCLD